jgi:hypothetical protein
MDVKLDSLQYNDTVFAIHEENFHLSNIFINPFV